MSDPTLRYIVNQTEKDNLDASYPPDILYWDDGGICYTSLAHLEYIDSLGLYTLDPAAIIASLATEPENENIIIIQEVGAVRFFDQAEKIVDETTSSTDYEYLKLDTVVPADGNYNIEFTINMRYYRNAWQYQKYKVVVDGTTNITNPGRTGWVYPYLYDLAGNSIRGLDWSGHRVIPLTAGAHSISLRIGRTSSYSVTAEYGSITIGEV